MPPHEKATASLQLSCSTALCLDPDDIVNGTVTVTGNSVGDTATYSCDSGFELNGDETTTCIQVDVNSSVFLPSPPVCIREYCMNITEVAHEKGIASSQLSYFTALVCPDPVDIANGMVTFTGNSIDDTATYSCNSGFEPIRNMTTTCTQLDENSAVFPQPPRMPCRREHIVAR